MVRNCIFMKLMIRRAMGEFDVLIRGKTKLNLKTRVEKAFKNFHSWSQISVSPMVSTQKFWKQSIYLQYFSFLMKSNLYRIQCYLPSWYLATDMQIFVFTPIILVPFAISKALGLIVAVLALSLSTSQKYLNFRKLEKFSSQLLPSGTFLFPRYRVSTGLPGSSDGYKFVRELFRFFQIQQYFQKLPKVALFQSLYQVPGIIFQKKNHN